MISTLFSSLNTNKNKSGNKKHQPQIESNQPQPILFILEKTMPIFKEICDLFISDEQVIEVRIPVDCILECLNINNLFFQFEGAL